jgi:hypothetical protein
MSQFFKLRIIGFFLHNAVNDRLTGLCLADTAAKQGAYHQWDGFEPTISE